MALRQFNPVTASLRGTVLINRSELWKGKPVKALTEGKNGTGGRNNHGRITSRFIGGGHKQAYRYVDFKRRKFDVPATVERLEYDPNRTAFIALVKYQDGELSYIIAPQRLRAGRQRGVRPACRHQAGQRDADGDDPGRHDHPQHRDEARRRRQDRALGGHLRAACRQGRRLGADQAGSGELRMVRAECMASIGAVSNPDNMNQKIGKAGRTRWMGTRPHNRGVVMNPVDHLLWAACVPSSASAPPCRSSDYVVGIRHRTDRGHALGLARCAVRPNQLICAQPASLPTSCA